MDVIFHIALSQKKWDALHDKLLMLIVTKNGQEVSGHVLQKTK